MEWNAGIVSAELGQRPRRVVHLVKRDLCGSYFEAAMRIGQWSYHSQSASLSEFVFSEEEAPFNLTAKSHRVSRQPSLHQRRSRLRPSRIESDRHIARTLRKPLSERDALDILWSLTGADNYRLFVTERGWPPEKYEKWLSDTLKSPLFGRAPRTLSHLVSVIRP